MRNYSKTGGRKGLPGYRTPSAFRYKKYISSVKIKTAAKVKFRKQGK